jgi:hypothetical protein
LEKFAISNKRNKRVIRRHILNLNKVIRKITDSGKNTSNKGLRKIGKNPLDLSKTRE